MQTIDFVATENVKDTIELELFPGLEYKEACKVAEDIIKQQYPLYDNIEVIGINTNA